MGAPKPKIRVSKTIYEGSERRIGKDRRTGQKDRRAASSDAFAGRRKSIWRKLEERDTGTGIRKEELGSFIRHSEAQIYYLNHGAKDRNESIDRKMGLDEVQTWRKLGFKDVHSAKGGKIAIGNKDSSEFIEEARRRIIVSDTFPLHDFNTLVFSEGGKISYPLRYDPYTKTVYWASTRRRSGKEDRRSNTDRRGTAKGFVVEEIKEK